jgi:serine/threonine protein kinase
MEYCDGGYTIQTKAGTIRLKYIDNCFWTNISYLHAQRPPIIHLDLKPENFLIHSGAYKLCDFGSAVVGHVELKTFEDRNDEEEVIKTTTTQIFRSVHRKLLICSCRKSYPKPPMCGHWVVAFTR